MPDIKNLKKAAIRIKKAIEKKENIIIYSDTDLDGATSFVILEETIKNLGGEIAACYFPDRAKDGYGLSSKALQYLKKYAPGILILLDCGIGNFKEVKIAGDLGFEVIIIEHHEILNNVLPLTSIIVNPKQKEDKYPFKFLATCGLSFKLAKELLKKKMSKNLEQSFLELVALGTISDMMIQEQDNKILTEKGLNYLLSTFRPGLRAFFKLFEDENFTPSQFAQKVISILQITDSKKHLTESYLVLSSEDEKKAFKLLKEIYEKNLARQELLRELTQEIKEKLSNNPLIICFEGGEYIPLNITGSLATRICNKFEKPTFIFNSEKKLSRGSVRVPKGINSVKSLESCADLFETYGGHPPASGFTIKTERLPELKKCLEKYFESHK